jgi:putative flippase GtrA
VLRRFFMFVVCSTTAVLMSVGLASFCVYFAGWSSEVGVASGIVVAATWNFFLNSNVTWQAWWSRKLLASPRRSR